MWRKWTIVLLVLLLSCTLATADPASPDDPPPTSDPVEANCVRPPSPAPPDPEPPPDPADPEPPPEPTDTEPLPEPTDSEPPPEPADSEPPPEPANPEPLPDPEPTDLPAPPAEIPDAVPEEPLPTARPDLAAALSFTQAHAVALRYEWCAEAETWTAQPVNERVAVYATNESDQPLTDVRIRASAGHAVDLGGLYHLTVDIDGADCLSFEPGETVQIGTFTFQGDGGTTAAAQQGALSVTLWAEYTA